jgi:hypothetical protein
MADSLQEHMYPTTKDNIGEIMALPFASQFDDLYNLVSQLLFKIDGE